MRVGVVVLTGAGDKAFCAGSDAKEFSKEFLRRPRNFWKFQGLLADALNLFRHLGKPTIARLNGVVAGAGNDWNLAADLAIAADHVRFMQMGTRVGLVESKRLATLAVDTEVRFRSPTERAAFSNELTEAITKLSTSKYHDESAYGAAARIAWWSWRALCSRNPIPRSHYEREERTLRTPFRPG